MIDIFNSGEDIHYSTAQTLTSGEIDKETRKKAKAVNFGFVYGMWPPKFKKYAKEKFGLDLTTHEAELYREAFFDKYPGLLLWHSRVESFVSQNGYIDSVFGRRRHLPDAKFGSGVEEWLRRECVRQGINSPIQSAGSDLNLFINNLISSRHLPWAFKIDPIKAFMVASAHDSQIFEVHRSYVDELKAGIKYTLENLPLEKYFGFKFRVPILMDVQAYRYCWEGSLLDD
jgi:DNA polymerase-1